MQRWKIMDLGHSKQSLVVGMSLVAGLALLGACSGVSPSASTTATGAGGKSSRPAPATPAAVSGQALADSLMAKWEAEHPDVDWEAEERKSRTFIAAADNKHLLSKDSQADGHPYRNVTERDVLEWKRETEKFVVAGSKVFHSADELGSTVGVSCDMCHPNAANTHPETYPKFQTQLGRVVLLRDMINWCLQQPLRAPAMEADDPRMRALEAYIISQRTGTKIEYGKH